ncbi:MAG: hypothetical protein LBB14_01125 [Puniceicoccales bacterium]|nr:hypothetical protein [Puniceicoccales bacterium]
MLPMRPIRPEITGQLFAKSVQDEFVKLFQLNDVDRFSRFSVMLNFGCGIFAALFALFSSKYFAGTILQSSALPFEAMAMAVGLRKLGDKWLAPYLLDRHLIKGDIKGDVVLWSVPGVDLKVRKDSRGCGYVVRTINSNEFAEVSHRIRFAEEMATRALDLAGAAESSENPHGTEPAPDLSGAESSAAGPARAVSSPEAANQIGNSVVVKRLVLSYNSERGHTGVNELGSYAIFFDNDFEIKCDDITFGPTIDLFGNEILDRMSFSFPLSADGTAFTVKWISKDGELKDDPPEGVPPLDLRKPIQISAGSPGEQLLLFADSGDIRKQRKPRDISPRIKFGYRLFPDTDDLLPSCLLCDSVIFSDEED